MWAVCRLSALKQGTKLAYFRVELVNCPPLDLKPNELRLYSKHMAADPHLSKAGAANI